MIDEPSAFAFINKLPLPMIESKKMNANELADELNRKLSGRLIGFTAAMLRQQQAEIEALKKQEQKDYEVISDLLERNVALKQTKQLSETRIKQIFVEQTGFYFDDNPADDLALMDFAKALLLEAQEK